MNARWDPFRDALSLREAMDRLLEQSVVSPRGAGPGGATARGGQPLPIDMWETADSIVVRAPLPGARADEGSLDVSVEGNVLTIRAQILAGADEEHDQAAPGQGNPTNADPGQAGRGVRWIVREIPRGEVSRVVELPTGVDADRASARFANGLLELTLPKVQTARARRINVTAE